MHKRLFLPDFKNQGKHPSRRGFARVGLCWYFQSGVFCRKEQEEYKLGQGTYSCQDFRIEMVILGLYRRLQDPALSKEEKEQILARLRELEAEAGMD